MYEIDGLKKQSLEEQLKSSRVIVIKDVWNRGELQRVCSTLVEYDAINHNPILVYLIASSFYQEYGAVIADVIKHLYSKVEVISIGTIDQVVLNFIKVSDCVSCFSTSQVDMGISPFDGSATTLSADEAIADGYFSKVLPSVKECNW